MTNTHHRLAVVGIGAIAGMHARAIADLPNATLVAGSCRTEAKGRKFTEQFGGNWYADFNEMLDTEKPTAVSIATPSGAHLEPALAAIERGIPVLIEKPIEITTERIDIMLEAADKAGVPIGGIFPQRFNPVVKAVHEAAASGRFGEVAIINTYVPWWRDDDYYAPDRWQGTFKLDGGGALMNQSIHGVDAIQWLAQAIDSNGDPGVNPVEQVFAFTGKRGHDANLIEVEDTCVAVLKYRSGALGQILAATSMWPGQLRRVQIAGRDGSAEILEEQLVHYQFRNESAEDEMVRNRFSGDSASEGGASDPMAIDYSNHTRNIAAFLDALDGKGELPVDGREARKAVAIIEAIYESANTGRAVTVN
ncbi:MAG: Gfo/Idh/MocA family oxidoreductase [Phycisphaeraceae bacterium]